MFCSHVRYVCLYVCMYVCTKSFLKTTTNSSCVCTHLANKADSDSDSDHNKSYINGELIYSAFRLCINLNFEKLTLKTVLWSGVTNSLTMM